MSDDNGNLLAGLPSPAAEELLTPLAEGGRFRLLRVVSTGQATPADQWYDQPENEWVVVLSGRAGLRIAGETTRELGPGDWLLLPAHRRHRVEWTAPDEPTVWLALHFSAD